ncbi:MAG: DMT family transporter [Clostridiales bacterium]|nr:DMT family transporter [Clostridiales bacterium]
MSKTAQLLIIFAAMCWGLIGTCTRPLGAAGFSYAEVAAARCLIASVGIFAFLLLADRGKAKIHLRDVPVFACMGGVGIALGFLCYFYTLGTITMSAAAILLNTAPYYVMLMSALFFKEKITMRKFGALITAFAGCVMTVGFFDKGDISFIGVGMGLLSALCYSLYTIFGKATVQKYSPLTVTAYTYGMASVCLLPLCNFGHVIGMFGENASNIALCLVLGLLMTLLPSVCYMKGLGKLEPSRVSTLAFFEPLTASVAGFLVYSEELSLIKITGIALIFLSVLILNLKPGTREKLPG